MAGAVESMVTEVGGALKPWFAPPPGWRRPEPRRVLALKLCCVGDLVFATAALRELRRGLPNSRIDLAVGTWSRPAIEHCPYINGLIEVREPGRSALEQRRWLTIVNQLRAGRYDWCLVFDRSPLLALLPWLAKIPLRAGLDSLNRGFAHNVRAPVRPVRHESDLYLDVVRAVGIEPLDGATEFAPGADDCGWARERLGALRHGFSGPVILLHPGGGQNPGMTFGAKQWPAERYGAVARLALDELRATVILVGGKTDRQVVDRVLATVGVSPQLHDLTGQTTLGQLAALAAQADAWIGNDTGPTHLAIAVGTPSVAIFGPTDPRRYGPRRPNGHVVWAAADMAAHLALDWAPDQPYRLGAVTQPPSARVDTVWAALGRALATGRVQPPADQPVWPAAP